VLKVIRSFIKKKALTKARVQPYHNTFVNRYTNKKATLIAQSGLFFNI
jgi:hypothetical protein